MNIRLLYQIVCVIPFLNMFASSLSFNVFKISFSVRQKKILDFRIHVLYYINGVYVLISIIKNTKLVKEFKGRYNMYQITMYAKVMNKMKKFRTIELFAGAGGLALGVEKAGFITVGAVELDHDACETLRKNRPEWNIFEGDIAELTRQNLVKFYRLEPGELDLLSGGAPCQAFSYAGKRLGFEDTRGTLFYHYAQFLQQLKPKMFLFENVRGLLNHDGGRTYKTICNVFNMAGYTIQKSVLNAWDYNTPQKRERLITVGIRNDLVDKCEFVFPKKCAYKPVLRDILNDVPDSPYIPYGEKKRKLFELVPPGGYWRDIDPKLAKEYMKSCWDMEGGRTGILRRLSMDEPSLTVLTSPSQKQTERCHPLEARPFTVRENARIQGFPDIWKFMGSVSSQYRQIGNAVPVNLAFYVAKELHRTLEAIYGLENQIYQRDRAKASCG